jgi:hypothetical protein
MALPARCGPGTCRDRDQCDGAGDEAEPDKCCLCEESQEYGHADRDEQGDDGQAVGRRTGGGRLCRLPALADHVGVELLAHLGKIGGERVLQLRETNRVAPVEEGVEEGLLVREERRVAVGELGELPVLLGRPFAGSSVMCR